MKYLPLLLLLALVGCGTLHNGGEASLSRPAAPVLFIPPPTHALMSAQAATTYVRDLANALNGYGVPCVAGDRKGPSWQLRIAAVQTGDQIIPAYHILGPDRKVYGKLNTAPVPALGWKAGDDSVLAQTASRDSQGLSRLLTRINADVQIKNPHSLLNRAARVFVGDMTGPPDDERLSLPADLSQHLTDSGLDIVNTPMDADFSVTGIVKTSPVMPAQTIVQLSWFVRDSNGRLVGEVVTLHELKTTDMPAYWQNMAATTTPQSTAGILRVIKNDQVKKTSLPDDAHK